MTANELDRRLAAYLGDEAEAPAPAGLLEQVIEGTSRRRPRPTLLASLRSPAVAGGAPGPDVRGRSPQRVALMTAAVVGALLAVVAFGWWIGRPPVTPLVSPTPSPAASIEPTPAPTATASPTPPTTPEPTPEPTLPPLGVAWEPVPVLGGGAPVRVVAGSGGWVAVGNECGACDLIRANAWFSTDGDTWSGGPLPEADDVQMQGVAFDGSQWFAGGVRYDRGGSGPLSTSAVVWRSSNGIAWSLVSEFALGECFEGCPWFEHIAAGPGGVILAWVHTEATGVYWSADGSDFQRIPSSAFDLGPTQNLVPTDVTVAGGRFVLVGGSCANECAKVWSSANGRDWRLDGTLAAAPDHLDVATDGARLLVVAQSLIPEDDTVVWTSADGRTGWTLVPDGLPIWLPRVTYLDGSFVVAGLRTPGGLGLHASTDGAEWAQVDAEAPIDDCRFTAFAGFGGRLLLLGDDANCSGAWMSRAP